MPGELLIHYGNPGSGKTLFAMKEIILPCCKEHRPFFTNITGISVSALSALTGVHQAFIKYFEVQNIHDVITYFDDEKICHDGVFILDEMKDFIDDEKAVSWLESRINVMRKQCVDFVLIAQQPAKEYIHPNIIKLANASNVYRTRKREKDLSHVTKYYVNGGLPKILNDDVSNSVGKEILKKPYEMYNCYKTSESAFYTGAEDKTSYVLPWYKERAWKLRFVLIGVCVVVVAIVIHLLYSLFSLPSDLISKDKEKSSSFSPDLAKPATNISEVGINEISCYKWKICDDKFCQTDIGKFPIINHIDNRLCTRNKCFSQCQESDLFSSSR